MGKSLRTKGIGWLIAGVILGVLSTWLWLSSSTAWQSHLNRAYTSGALLYDALRYQAPAPDGMTITPLRDDLENKLTPQGFPKPDGINNPRVTTASIIEDQFGTQGGIRLQLYVFSNIQYPLGKLQSPRNMLPSARLGEISQLMASYCSDPQVYARLEQGAWMHIAAPALWTCAATPYDTRLLAAALMAFGVILIVSQITDISGQFTRFSQSLSVAGRFGTQERFSQAGPTELQSLITALNEYLDVEQDRIEKRALVLSGVSHDLGTPATRLRLRTALIEDDDLRAKLEADIDKMTSMIDSVLTYTRSEMNTEKPRLLSLTSLVQSVVDDYEDVGKPVRLLEQDSQAIDRGRSIFGGGGNQSFKNEDARRILITARPISLQRAIANLIDNALKYGRRATVCVEATSKQACIIVEDEGTQMSDERLLHLTRPFERGENAQSVEGVGLGLTVVTTIANQHGGDLTFTRLPTGMQARLTLRRS